MLGQSGFMICLGCFKSHHNGLFSVGHGQTDTILGGNGHHSLLYFNSPSRVAGGGVLQISIRYWCTLIRFNFGILFLAVHAFLWASTNWLVSSLHGQEILAAESPVWRGLLDIYGALRTWFRTYHAANVPTLDTCLYIVHSMCFSEYAG